MAHEEIDRLEKEIQKLKEDINSKSEELDIRQRCLKEFQMMATEKQVREPSIHIWSPIFFMFFFHLPTYTFPILFLHVLSSLIRVVLGWGS